MGTSTDAGGWILRATGLRIGYDGRALLSPLDFEMGRGELWGVIGPNGSGKTTLVRTLLGLQPRVDGRVETAAGVRVAYLPQRADGGADAPGRVRDAVTAGFDRAWSFLDPLAGLRRRAETTRLLEEVGAGGVARRQLSQVSEGQRQRALVAAALASGPDLLALDEPTSALDPGGQRSVMEMLRDLSTRRGLSLLVVSHGVGLLLASASHLLYLDRDCGCVVAGPRDAVLSSPALAGHFLEPEARTWTTRPT